MRRISFFVAIGVAMGVAGPSLHAEEGLWTLEQAARPEVASRLGLIEGDGIRHRSGSNMVQFPTGVSGTLVSRQGLVVSVREVAVPCLNAASRTGIDYVRNGWMTGVRGELRCPHLSVERFAGGVDVTQRLRQGLGRGEAIPVERIADLEKECRKESGLDCRVALLFDGASARLDRLHRYNDVRLVFAPEARIAAYGNTEARQIFPRYSLDVAFFRIYENGEPLLVPSPMLWNSEGVAANASVLVAAYPGPTERYLPWVYLEPLSSSGYRMEAKVVREQVKALQSLVREVGESTVQEMVHAELDRIASDLRSSMAVLQNRPIRNKQRAIEKAWRELFGKQDAREAEIAWAAAGEAADHFEAFYQRYVAIEGGRTLPFGKLFDVTRQLVRFCDERRKPEADRLPEYRGSRLAALERRLSEPLPFSGPAEEALLTTGLARLRTFLNESEPLARELDSEPIADQAARLIASTRMGDEAARRRVLESGDLGDLVDDPLVAFVRLIETEAKPLRCRYEQVVARRLSHFARLLGERLHAADSTGNAHYSNTTRDLRLSTGRVNGFLDFGRDVPAITTMGGLISRSVRAQPGSFWRLPRQWISRQRQIDLAKPLNFIVDADVGSGAPGGAVMNRNGEFVGMVIDSTLKSAVNRFLYRGRDERAIAVHPAGILEALRRVYDADKLADELVQRSAVR